jgi:choice-of-anchor C domain-containing protein
MSKAALVLGLVLSVVLPAQAAGQTSIVVNGDFESPAVPGSFQVFFPPGFDSWTVDAGSVDVVHELWTAASGVQSVDLNGNCCAAGAISQVLPTTAGTTYTLSFAFAGNPDPNPICASSPVVKQMEVFWDGASAGTFTFDTTGHTLADPGWQTTSLSVTAPSGATTLRFGSLIPGACGPTIDDVAVVAAGGPPQETRPGLGCGDPNHVHEREAECRQAPR